MKKRKIIALTLLVAFLCSLCIPGTWAIAGDEDTTPPATENEGMEISKTAKANGDDTYTITLEAYATGEKISTEVTKDVPTDIILVLDQSGSMTNSMNTYIFRAYTNKSNSDYYDLRHNGAHNPNLYYQLEDGGYAAVAVTVQHHGLEYTAIEKGRNNDSGDWWNPYTNYWENQNNLYAKVNGEYQKVTVERTGPKSNRTYIYTLSAPNGSKIGESKGNKGEPTFSGIDDGMLYLASVDEAQNVYTYTYTNKDGAVQTIGSSTGAGTRPTDFTLYERYVTSSVSRLQALQTVVTGFKNSVAEKAAGKDGELGTADDVDHRIAVVGFSCSNTGSYYYYKNYQNTELFIGATQYQYNAQYNGAASQYGNAFQSMKTTDGQNNVIASIDALDADGATYVNHGLEMANGILDANPVPAGEKRNRVVIVFTDGTPGWNGYDEKVANSAITEANTARSKGANVYSVGIFGGADATSAGDESGDDTQKANWFMQNLSDNKGTPQTPSYYLSASDADTLNNIFQQISDNIESGGSGTTLDENAVIKDVISPQFQLPAGATAKDITLETYSYTGEGQWSKNNDAMGATAAVNGDQVNVTGFDFAENWCGTETQNGTTTYRGNKLVISFPVKAKDGFLGGNGVYTNTSAGVYENAGAENPLFTFERPQVDVPIKVITVKAEDKNVYLTGSLTKDQLKAGTVLKFGDKEIDLSKANDKEKPYGLEPWQTEYVTIAMGNVKDKNGNVISDSLNNLTENQKYTVTVDITPTTEGNEIAKSCSGDGNINVFKPELTFKDSEVYYGDFVPTNFDGNLVSTVWKHENIEADAEKMGTAPTLTMIYTPDSEKTAGGKINSKTVDIPVDVSVKIDTANVTENTTFHHECSVQDVECEWNKIESKDNIKNIGAEKAKLGFLLHPKTCQLTVRKTGGAAGEPYVFNVYKDGDTNKPYTQVTIVGNDKETIYELPVGTYTIQEDTGWSWRYSANNGNSVTLSAEADHHEGTITCTNNKENDKWLNGYSTVVKNIFGVSHNN